MLPGAVMVRQSARPQTPVPQLKLLIASPWPNTLLVSSQSTLLPFQPPSIAMKFAWAPLPGPDGPAMVGESWMTAWAAPPSVSPAARIRVFDNDFMTASCSRLDGFAGSPNRSADSVDERSCSMDERQQAGRMSQETGIHNSPG